ncbi:MAG: TIGR02757 family protein [Bacteroidales bacterium]|nr:TIGR02757 family protein [Bacteroidales bacterium]
MKNDRVYVKEFLDKKVSQFNRQEFIPSDPIQVPHAFYRKEDIEIAAFLTAMLAWGQRKTIIRKARQLLGMMNNSPYDFIRYAGKDHWKHLESFRHRTFNGIDTLYFVQALKNIVIHYGSLQELFESAYLQTLNIKQTLQNFRSKFFELPFPSRTLKHIPDVGHGSSVKRLNLFLRWMVRCDSQGVDFGIWKKIPPSALYIPLDVHSGTVARKLGLLKRKQNDWQAVEELTAVLRIFDSNDPVKYDYALFGMGAGKDLLI